MSTPRSWSAVHTVPPGTELGGIGQGNRLLVGAVRASGVATVVAVDPVPARRDMALRIGADAVLGPAAVAVVEAVRDLTGGGATYALDTSGIPSVITEAALALGRAGALALVGLGPADLTLDVQDLVLNGKTVRGCIEGDAKPREFIPHLLQLRAKRLLPVEDTISAAVYQPVLDAA
ncbi:zinc-binding dehydrogenase [Streptomyces sp. B21-108]|uniref:zinc-binding dehydrogenase n=1 Tax=Streptomyces sp. B21-108 TaxID=3039419 RepID=UPI002FF42F6D